MKTLLILALTVFCLSKVALFAVDSIMDNTNDPSLIEDHKRALDNI